MLSVMLNQIKTDFSYSGRRFCNFFFANFWVTELIDSYEDERPVNGMAIMEFRNGKVAHETLFCISI
jgi:hypothetical protein